jgi:hypothetical protein
MIGMNETPGEDAMSQAVPSVRVEVFSDYT